MPETRPLKTKEYGDLYLHGVASWFDGPLEFTMFNERGEVYYLLLEDRTEDINTQRLKETFYIIKLTDKQQQQELIAGRLSVRQLTSDSDIDRLTVTWTDTPIIEVEHKVVNNLADIVDVDSPIGVGYRSWYNVKRYNKTGKKWRGELEEVE